MQSTSHLLMIRPVNFGFNAETAVNNHFQENIADGDTQEKAKAEFDALVSKLRANDIDVTVIDDTPAPYTPDSIFPNNWISFHTDGRIYLYPMFAQNRRKERKPHIIELLSEKFTVTETIDLSGFENSHQFLEGTGSMVLDRDRKIAYACISPRTDLQVFETFCTRENYLPVSFTATDQKGGLIYHTNVLMCVADRYVVICLDSIRDAKEKQMVADTIINSGKELLPITLEQMDHFAGNMLQVQNQKGQTFLVMSTQAYKSLTDDQLARLLQYDPVIHSDITQIETNGGGSARCMIAEIFLRPLPDHTNDH